LWRELDRETQAFGLATTGGTVSNTGIAGLTLGGGLGWLMGKHGLTVDNLLSADVVTADGEYHTVSAEREPDLFWALRGGSGNFGIVTSFEYRLHPVGQILGGMVVYPLDQAKDVARFYRDLCPTLPDEAEAYLGFITEPQAGVPVVAMLLGYNGPLDEGEKVLAPARQFGRPLADLVSPMPYTVRQTLLDEPLARNGLQRYWRSAFADQMPDQLIDVVVEAASNFTSPMSFVVYFYMHGAAIGVPAAETAFSRAARCGMSTFWASGTTRPNPIPISPGCGQRGTRWHPSWEATPMSTTSPEMNPQRGSAPPTDPTTGVSAS
jgi:hypothetical protein